MRISVIIEDVETMKQRRRVFRTWRAFVRALPAAQRIFFLKIWPGAYATTANCYLRERAK